MIGLKPWLPPSELSFVPRLSEEFKHAKQLSDFDRPSFWLPFHEFLDPLFLFGFRKKNCGWLQPAQRHQILREFCQQLEAKIRMTTDELPRTIPAVVGYFAEKQVEYHPSVLEKSATFLDLRWQLTQRHYAILVANQVLIRFAQVALQHRWLECAQPFDERGDQAWSQPIQDGDALLESLCIRFHNEPVCFLGHMGKKRFFPWLQVLRNLRWISNMISVLLSILEFPLVLRQLILAYVVDESFIVPIKRAVYNTFDEFTISAAGQLQWDEFATPPRQQSFEQNETKPTVADPRISLDILDLEVPFAFDLWSPEEEKIITQGILNRDAKITEQILNNKTVQAIMHHYGTLHATLLASLELVLKHLDPGHARNRFENKVEPQFAFITRLTDTNPALALELLKHTYLSQITNKEEFELTVPDLKRFAQDVPFQWRSKWFDSLNQVYIRHRLRWRDQTHGLLWKDHKDRCINYLTEWLSLVLMTETLKNQETLVLISDNKRILYKVNDYTMIWSATSLLWRDGIRESPMLTMCKEEKYFTLKHRTLGVSVGVQKGDLYYCRFLPRCSKKRKTPEVTCSEVVSHRWISFDELPMYL